jgi:4-hydroxy-tetrahydrodipicolinate reductase
MQLSVGVIGVTGKLGRRICEQAREMECRISLSACSREWVTEAVPDVVIDVSHDSAFDEVARFCSATNTPLVEGVSTLSPEHLAQLRGLSTAIPVIYAPNFTFGHYLQRSALMVLAHILKTNSRTSECTVTERHPTSKKDRPSATAQELAAFWSESAECPVAEVASVRGGLPVSDHEAAITLSGEMLSIKHSTTDRVAAARGALQAGRWVVLQSSGFYKMSDVYGMVREEAHD